MRNAPRLLVCFVLTSAIVLPLSAQFRIVGYVPDWAGSPTYVQYDKVTHINYAFVLPSNGTGGITSPNSSLLNTLVTQAHTHDVKVLVSIGGWNDGDDSRFHALAANQTYINTFVRNCTTLVSTYNLDGIDIDWEYPDAGTSADQYVTLMTALANALHPRGKLLTAAVIGHADDGIKNEVFAIVDFLNIMSYDGGTPHSSYSMASSDLRSWRVRGLPREKAVLGVPFYGRDPYTSYADLCVMDAQAPFKDQVGIIYYNGIATIQRKTRLAADSGSGIMMWELSQDVSGTNSLLKAVYDASPITPIASRPADKALAAAPLQVMQNYPNPVRTRTQIPLRLANASAVSIDIIAAQGGVVRTLARDAALGPGIHAFAWDATNLSGTPVPSGVYLYRVTMSGAAGRETAVRMMRVMR